MVRGGREETFSSFLNLYTQGCVTHEKEELGAKQSTAIQPKREATSISRDGRTKGRNRFGRTQGWVLLEEEPWHICLVGAEVSEKSELLLEKLTEAMALRFLPPSNVLLTMASC